MASRDSLHFLPSSQDLILPHLPPSTPCPTSSTTPKRPWTTLTFATSLDSMIAAAPGTQTVLSGAETKAMTHFLRSRHDAILIGIGTAKADNPSLNCRLSGVGGYGGKGLFGQPRPVILDPRARWEFEGAKIVELARTGRGLAPWILVAIPTELVPVERRQLLEAVGGRYICLPSTSSVNSRSHIFQWAVVLELLAIEGIESVMIEGGGYIINSLLQEPESSLVDSVIVTIAPVWLGEGGVVIAPPRQKSGDENRSGPLKLKGTKWHQFGDDVVLCGALK